METTIAIIECSDGWTTHHIVSNNAEEAAADENLICLIPGRLFKKIQNWLKDLETELSSKGLEILKTKYRPIFGPSHTPKTPVRQTYVRVHIGHWNGLDKRGALDGCAIEKLF